MFEKALKIEKRWIYSCRINGCRCSIAILAAIAMPQFLSAADRARTAKETADIQIIKNATQLYMIDKNVDTPPTVENLYKEAILQNMLKLQKIENIPLLMKRLMVVLAKAVVVKALDAP